MQGATKARIALKEAELNRLYEQLSLEEEYAAILNDGDWPVGTVFYFTRAFPRNPGYMYTYAAIRWGEHNHGMRGCWAITGNQETYLTWEQLRDHWLIQAIKSGGEVSVVTEWEQLA